MVIDACVALKWRLRDEEATAQADQLLDDYLSGTLGIVVPALFDYETANALRVAAARGRMAGAEAAAAHADLMALELDRRPFAVTSALAFQLCVQHGRSAYDAAYLALAFADGRLLYTGDRRLYNAVSALLPWVRWIGDYRLDDVPVAPQAWAPV